MVKIHGYVVAEGVRSSQQEIKNILTKLDKSDQIEKVVNSYRTIISNNRIVSLDLIGLGIKDVAPDIFYEINGISQLYLSWNKIDNFPQGIFDRLSTLQYLDLRGSGLNTIRKGLFDNLQNLKRLELNDNKLKIIPNNIFDKLISLNELNLSNNQIELLDPHIFDKLTNLERLYLYFNPLPGDISFSNYYDRESVDDLIALLKSYSVI